MYRLTQSFLDNYTDKTSNVFPKQSKKQRQFCQIMGKMDCNQHEVHQAQFICVSSEWPDITGGDEWDGEGNTTICVRLPPSPPPWQVTQGHACIPQFLSHTSRVKPFCMIVFLNFVLFLVSFSVFNPVYLKYS